MVDALRSHQSKKYPNRSVYVFTVLGVKSSVLLDAEGFGRAGS
jgi:hypothetical protein